ncbi:MAG: YlxR family protein [bacterium]|nr:YlxR family protein [bacterium]
MKKIPLRMCVVTKNREEKRNLLRIVKTKDGEILVDTTGKLNGKGAYITKSPEVLALARKNKALDRALDTEISEEVYKKIAENI